MPGCSVLLRNYFLPNGHIQGGSTWLLSSFRSSFNAPWDSSKESDLGEALLHRLIVRKSHNVLEENCGQKSDSVSMVLFTQYCLQVTSVCFHDPRARSPQPGT